MYLPLFVASSRNGSYKKQVPFPFFTLLTFFPLSSTHFYVERKIHCAPFFVLTRKQRKEEKGVFFLLWLLCGKHKGKLMGRGETLLLHSFALYCLPVPFLWSKKYLEKRAGEDMFSKYYLYISHMSSKAADTWMNEGKNGAVGTTCELNAKQGKLLLIKRGKKLCHP